MKSILKMIVAVVLSVFILQGCGTYHFVQVPEETKVSKAFDIELTPIDMSINDAYAGFYLSVTNNSAKEVKINWNKTYYMEDNETLGTFMFDDTRFQDRLKAKAPDAIASHTTLTKYIYPNHYAVHYDHGWTNNGFDTGQRGILLTLVTNGKDINQTVILDIKSGEKEEK